MKGTQRMANNVPDNGRPNPNDPQRKMVVVPVIQHESLNIMWALMASVVSVVAHLLLVLLIMNIQMRDASAAPAGEIQTTSEVADEEKPEKELDLTNTDIGEDSTKQINFNVDRIEEVSVPGEVKPTEAVGIANAPEGPARSLSAPPGIGHGQGGAPMMAESGTGSPFGQMGGGGGLAMLGGFGGRSGATRQKMLDEGGGNKLSEAAVAMGIEWLSLHQAPDGHWSLHEFPRYARDKPIGENGKIITCQCGDTTNRRDEVAGTAFAMLPFLAAGMTHKSLKAGAQQKDYSKVCQAGINFLMQKQGKDGFYGGGGYSHGLATIVMCEAFGLTSDPLIKQSCQRGLNYIVEAQDPAGGGWRYSPKQPGDTSVTGWMIMALKSGQMSGLTVPPRTIKMAEKFLDSVEVKGAGDGYGSGLYSYTPGGAAMPTVTAVALLCRMYTGINPKNLGLLKGIDYLKKYPPGKTGNKYYEYYATQVMHHMGGDAWDFWNKGPGGNDGIRDYYVNEMDKGDAPKAHQRGSWKPDPRGGHANDGGRIMSTGLTLLGLEVYYRHLPLYRRDVGAVKKD